MKVYERKYTKFAHPEDMKLILDYLNERGKILVREGTIENLYYEFSETHCAGWLIVHEETLAAFEEWLTKVDI